VLDSPAGMRETDTIQMIGDIVIAAVTMSNT
jgi:hypothetical protein